MQKKEGSLAVEMPFSKITVWDAQAITSFLSLFSFAFIINWPLWFIILATANFWTWHFELIKSEL